MEGARKSLLKRYKGTEMQGEKGSQRERLTERGVKERGTEQLIELKGKKVVDRARGSQRKSEIQSENGKNQRVSCEQR